MPGSAMLAVRVVVPGGQKNMDMVGPYNGKSFGIVPTITGHIVRSELFTDTPLQVNRDDDGRILAGLTNNPENDVVIVNNGQNTQIYSAEYLADNGLRSVDGDHTIHKAVKRALKKGPLNLIPAINVDLSMHVRLPDFPRYGTEADSNGARRRHDVTAAAADDSTNTTINSVLNPGQNMSESGGQADVMDVILNTGSVGEGLDTHWNTINSILSGNDDDGGGDEMSRLNTMVSTFGAASARRSRRDKPIADGGNERFLITTAPKDVSADDRKQQRLIDARRRDSPGFVTDSDPPRAGKR